MSERVKRAREAGALDSQRRVQEAIAQPSTIQHERDASRRKHKSEPRPSTTDPQARVMKMGDGGFRPAYNVQLATAGSPLGGPRTIVGVLVTHQGSDMNSIGPMLDDIERRTGALPDVLLADAGPNDHNSIRVAAARGVEALVPISDKGTGGHAENDAPIVAWRDRMQKPEAKQLYRARASLCELPNAHFKSRLGLAHLLVRGLNKGDQLGATQGARLESARARGRVAHLRRSPLSWPFPAARGNGAVARADTTPGMGPCAVVAKETALLHPAPASERPAWGAASSEARTVLGGRTRVPPVHSR